MFTGGAQDAPGTEQDETAGVENKFMRQVITMSFSEVPDMEILRKKLHIGLCGRDEDADRPTSARASFLNKDDLLASVEAYFASVERGDAPDVQAALLANVPRTGAGVRDPNNDLRLQLPQIVKAELQQRQQAAAGTTLP